ncbi:hypothetical protein CCMSSC00406_0007620 [Pleurotus cornucopiae]|uniref:Uncharacterized protein n=1 Tax=Pleurotus cornucopiae TaxID=5321 RepID=A0ACB7IYT8_PLECO|nr:hypothetical protein CCMSSC00406_0007620 [Pleurotus cornucopiae]
MDIVSKPRQYHPQEDAFADSLIPFYLQARELGELPAFFRAANFLSLDRFPLTYKQQHGVSKLSAVNKMKRSLALKIEVSALLRGRLAQEFLAPGYWKDFMSISADRERRRREWLSIGGVPRHHQYMVAFADCLDPFAGSRPRPTPSFGDVFTVITSHGLVPLLRFGLFPATTTDPRTAATFEVLRLFQILTFGSKVSGYEFYQSLVRLTNNLGGSVPDRYSAFMRMVREWRHIRLMKRMGRGHEESGVSGTREGECAVLCPACPQPNKNLPPHWKEVNDSQRWIYALFLAIDANFRLKRLSASSDARDPSLNRGCAYFVEERQYKEFLRDHGKTNIGEANTCNNYDAVKLASIRGGKGTTASGVGTIECSRHDMKRPVSVGDLQRGEQYINMDYLYFSSIRNHSPSALIVSYDIACQWSRNILLRSGTYPSELVGRAASLRTTYLVPKFHLYAHRTECQINYSFNLTPGVGRMDGESPERGWAAMNPVASSTKEMGPGSRRDTLDDHFGDYNWRKVATLHISLLRRVQEAVEMRSEHVGNFLDFSNSLPAAIVQQFYYLVHQWEAGLAETNPYEAKVEAISIKKIRLELAEEEALMIRRDEDLVIHDTVGPSIFITQGLELQDHQARLKIDDQALGNHATELQRTHILERRNRLMRRITTWQSIQELYVPGIGLYQRSSTDRSVDTFKAEDIDLLLPSNIIPRFHVNVKLAEYEFRLRYGSAHDLLTELRRQLLILGTMYQSKDRYPPRDPFESEFIIDVLSTILSRMKRSAGQYGRPKGAVALAAAGVERAFKSFQTGIYVRPDKFEQGSVMPAFRGYMYTLDKLSERRWEQILTAAGYYNEQEDTTHSDPALDLSVALLENSRHDLYVPSSPMQGDDDN